MSGISRHLGVRIMLLPFNLFCIKGGPGISSVWYGSFEMLGPLDEDFNPRETSWVSENQK